MLSRIESVSQLEKDVRVQVHNESDRQSALALVILAEGESFQLLFQFCRGPNYGGGDKFGMTGLLKCKVHKDKL